MKTRKISSLFRIVATMLVAATIGLVPVSLFASGGSGSGGGSGSVKVDSIKVSKCYCNGASLRLPSGWNVSR